MVQQKFANRGSIIYTPHIAQPVVNHAGTYTRVPRLKGKAAVIASRRDCLRRAQEVIDDACSPYAYCNILCTAQELAQRRRDYEGH